MIVRNRTRPYGRCYWRGKKFDNRTVSAVKWAEARYISVAPRKRRRFVIVQGSYNASVDVSGGTHDGGGSLDISTAGMNEKQKHAVVWWMRKAGFACYLRRTLRRPNGTLVWGEHIHAVLLWHRTASPAAKDQMQSYLNHRDALATNGPDPYRRPKVQHRWSHRQGRPIRV